MSTRDSNFALIWPSSTEVSRAIADERSGRGIDEELGVAADCEPATIAIDDRNNVSRYTIDRLFPRPHECGPAAFPITIGFPVGRHLLNRESAKCRARQHLLNERVLLKNKMFPVLRPQSPKERFAGGRQILPSPWLNKGLHVRDRSYVRWIAGGSVEAEGAAPVMTNDREVARKAQGLEPGIQMLRVIHKTIASRSRLAGLTHAAQIGGEASAKSRHIRDDVPPHVVPRRVAMEKDDGISLSDIDIAHLRREDLQPSTRVGIDHRLAS